MVLSMTVFTAPRAAQFNALTLRFQDEAYTLAYYMLGNDEMASNVTQKAFTGLFGGSGLHADAFRQAAMRNVLAGCRSAGLHPGPTATSDPLRWNLLCLNAEARAAVVLIDILGYSYNEAGGILKLTQKEVGKLLAQARAGLARMTEDEPAARQL